MVAPWVIPAAVSVGSSLLSGLTKGKKREMAGPQTITQEPLQTDTQSEMQKLLAQLAKTGQFGGMNLGEGYTGSLGDYSKSGLESGAQSQLMQLLQGGNPELFWLGQNELKNILTTDKYDPYAKGGVYEGFKKQTQRELTEGQDVLKRNLSISGGLSSSGMNKESGLLAERGQTALQSKLAELYQDFANRKTAAAGTALNAGIAERGMQGDLINQAMSVGSLDRLLKDAEAKDKLAEWTRARGEKLKQIDVANTLQSTPVQWGAKSITIPAQYEYQDSPWSAILNQIANISGNVAGQQYGKK